MFHWYNSTDGYRKEIVIKTYCAKSTNFCCVNLGYYFTYADFCYIHQYKTYN